MNVQITKDGVVEDYELDPSLDKFSLKESVRLEEALGAELFERLVSSGTPGSDVEAPASPKILQAIIWSKLATVRPDIGLDEFDLDLEDFEKFARPNGSDPKA